jgi:DNA-binding response OmpR family regulator
MAQKKVLYVDDEEALRILVKSQLTMEGFIVDTAEDGDVALDIIQRDYYDLILLDIRMPRIDGIEVLKKIKSAGVKSRVIMLTAVTELSSAIWAVKLGASDYITKPYNIDDLLSCIKRVLAK